MTIGTRLHTFLFGKKVGEDRFGNRYYVSKKDSPRRKRWVIYKGIAEPSKVPPEWHSWLHYTTDEKLNDDKYFWQKEHLPNLTGTKNAYSPPAVTAGERERVSSDYQAWKP